MIAWRVKWRTDDGKQHLDIVETETDDRDEAVMLGEIAAGGRALESIERIDETAYPSPLRKFP